MKTYKNDFDILKTKVNGQPLTYLDSGATSQKPRQVIEALADYYEHDNANIHRGIYTLSQRATDHYEAARDKVQHFIHAADRRSIIFTRSTTESLNWLAQSYGPANLKVGDEILLTYMEHHSNIVPWQVLAQKVGAKLKYVALDDQGFLDLDDLKRQLSDKTKLVTLTQLSNVLGVKTPVKEVVKAAHAVGAKVILDGAQGAPHMPVDVTDLDVDFYAFSGHKMMGPTGIGVLYGRLELLDQMPPAQYGGEMIERVGLYESTYTELPERFEAGTPNIAGAIGLGVAVDYLQSVGMDTVEAHEAELMAYAMDKLQAIDGLTIYGPKDPKQHHAVIAFNLAGVHPHDVATILDQSGVEVRAGHHCAQPLMDYLGVTATVRASFYLYNDLADIDRLVDALKVAQEYFAYE
ncbi:cysteine desulfurase [Leuconostocaceae bacterium ESL0723]|nr:cysteine desulfurase [Leuconostocaceae bacterium ESL0723]